MPAQMVMCYMAKAGVIAFMESIRGDLAADDAILAGMPTEVNPELIASLRQPPPPAQS
jgi:hypothetical protein